MITTTKPAAPRKTAKDREAEAINKKILDLARASDYNLVLLDEFSKEEVPVMRKPLSTKQSRTPRNPSPRQPKIHGRGSACTHGPSARPGWRRTAGRRAAGGSRVRSSMEDGASRMRSRSAWYESLWVRGRRQLGRGSGTDRPSVVAIGEMALQVVDRTFEQLPRSGRDGDCGHQD
jgi:hypothetical protein